MFVLKGNTRGVSSKSQRGAATRSSAGSPSHLFRLISLASLGANPAFSSAETVQKLQRALLRELRAQRAAAALVHPAGDGVHLLLLAAAAAVRLHAHMKASRMENCHWPKRTFCPRS